MNIETLELFFFTTLLSENRRVGRMVFHKEYLDLLLVPSGLCIMFIYHLYLLYRYLNIPHTTIMGFENNDKRAGIERIMQAGDSNTIVTALNVIGSNNNGATFLASVSLTLASLIGAWMANNSVFSSELIYGDTRPETMCIKFISLLIFFLVAFACFVQSSRCFIHANYHFATMVFWSLGLRALYFATTLLLWFFGPIPVFATSVGMVCSCIPLAKTQSNCTIIDLMQKEKLLALQLVQSIISFRPNFTLASTRSC